MAKPKPKPSAAGSTRKPSLAWISRADYDRIKMLFLEMPEDYARVSEAAGVSRQIAEQAWDRGWAGLAWAVPMRDAVEREFKLARAIASRPETAFATRRRSEAQETALAQEHAAKTRAQESKAITSARESVVGLFETLAELQPALRAFGLNLAKQLADPELELEPKLAVEILERAASATNRLARAMNEVMAAERKMLGQPEKMIGHMHGHVVMTREEALTTINLAKQAAVRTQADDIEDLLKDAEGARAGHRP